MSKKRNPELAIEISKLCFSWDSRAPILEIEHLQINRGERIFIEGPSGSGKSSLVKAGLIPALGHFTQKVTLKSPLSLSKP